MTTPLASIGLTYDAVDLQAADLSIFLEITSGLNEVAAVRGKDVLVPSADGQFARNRRKDHLDILLTGVVIGNGVDQAGRRAAYRASSRFLRDLFDPSRMPAALVASLEDGDTATILARPVNSIWNEIVKSEYAKISVALYSVAPDWTFT